MSGRATINQNAPHPHLGTTSQHSTIQRLCDRQRGGESMIEVASTTAQGKGNFNSPPA